jgi:hypothetical protein
MRADDPRLDPELCARWGYDPDNFFDTENFEEDGVVCRYCGCGNFSPCVLDDGEPCGWHFLSDEIAVCTNPGCVKLFIAGAL